MKTILRTVALAAACLLSTTAMAAQITTKNLPIQSGKSDVWTFDVAPVSYSQKTGSDVVRVDFEKGSKTATFTAIGASGSSKIEFTTSSDSVTLIEVEITDELDEMLPVFRRKAEQLGLKAEREVDHILVSGTIDTPEKWERFEQLLSRFKGKVQSDVVFKVSQSAIDALRAELVSAGVPLAPAGKAPAEGQIKMAYEGNLLSFSGVVYSENEVETLKRVLQTKNNWIALDAVASRGTSAAPKVQTAFGIAVDDSMLEADIAFLLVSRAEARKAGSEAGLVVKGAWEGFWDFLTFRHGHHDTSNLRIDASLASTLEFAAGETFVRDRKTGHFLFRANGAPVDGEDGVMRVGGTLKFTPPASGEGEAPQPQDFEYGFKVVNRGCRRVSADAAEINVKIEVNGEPQFDKRVRGSAISQSTVSLPVAAVTCAFGKTIAMSGFGHTGETTVEPTGTPIFRHIPIMNWFVSQQAENKEELDMLMLVSVRKVGIDDEPMVGNDKMKDITYDANRPNRARIDDEADRDGFRGCSPFYWLRW